MKTILYISLIFSLLLSGKEAMAYDNLTHRLLGKILLQVQDKGKAWYVNPADQKRYYLGKPHDAFNIMRSLGLGVKHSVITNTKIYPERLLGKILIDVEDKGKAYYINPTDRKAYYLGRPDDAFNIMRKLSVGISNRDLSRINVASDIDNKASSSVSEIEMQVYNLINKERADYGLKAYKLNKQLVKAGQNHADDMIALNYFAHDRSGKKFNDFVTELGLSYYKIGENIAKGQRSAEDIVAAWMNSPGHRAAILGDYEEIGVGIRTSGYGYLSVAYFMTSR